MVYAIPISNNIEAIGNRKRKIVFADFKSFLFPLIDTLDIMNVSKKYKSFDADASTNKTVEFVEYAKISVLNNNLQIKKIQSSEVSINAVIRIELNSDCNMLF